MTLLRDPDWRLLLALALLTLATWTAVAMGEEGPKAAHNASQVPSSACQCVEGENGSRPGESLEQRATRLERAWRLTRVEMWVNARRKVSK